VSSPTGFLGQILAHKREELACRKAAIPLREVERRAADAPPARNFTAALEARVAAGGPAIIAELKKASPSRGILRERFEPSEIAASYARHGAACISVLTDQTFFQGHDSHLSQARRSCQVPALRKDFLVDAYQVFESRGLDADAILLIAAALSDACLRDFAALASDLGMSTLVEVHDRDELERALAVGASLIGINNRSLRTFQTDLNTTLALLRFIPAGRHVVSESGIASSRDIDGLRARGVHTFLVGEALMRAPDPGVALAGLVRARQGAGNSAGIVEPGAPGACDSSSPLNADWTFGCFYGG